MRIRSVRGAVLASVMAASILLAQAVVPATAASAASSTPQGGKTLTVGEGSGITSLDPLHINGGGTSGGNEAGAVYGYLMRYDTSTGKYVPYLAKSLTSDAAFTTWTLTLRPGMTFSDGTPFNAQAVVENIQRDMDPANRSVAGVFLGLVQSVTATGPTTVVFTLKQAWAQFGYALSWVPGLIAAPSYIAEVDAGNANATPIGAGPFEVSNFQPGTSLTLKPNPRYALGKPSLSTLKFTFVPGGPATLQAFQAGQLNAAFIFDAASVQQAKEDGIPALTSNFDFGDILLMNNRSTSPLSNPKLREAITLAFDPAVYNERVNQGVQLASNLLFPKGSAWYSPDEEKVAHNLAKAKRLVAEVKQETGWNGTLNFICENTMQELGTAFQSMFQPIGITLNVTDDVPLTTLETDVIVDHNFDLSIWGISAMDVQPFPGLWTNFVSTSDYAGYTNPQMTAAIDALGAAATPVAQKAATKKIVSLWNSTYPVVNLGTSSYAMLHKSDVHGLTATVGGTTLFDKASIS